MMRNVEERTVKLGPGWVLYIENKRRKNIGHTGAS